MVGAACAKSTQLAGPLGTCKGESVLVVTIVRDHSAVGRQCATQDRQNLRYDVFTIGSRCVLQASERSTLLILMAGDKFAHLIDGVDAIEVAFSLRPTPSKESVAPQENPFNPGLSRTAFSSSSANSNPG